jgi:hypothetical protein
MQRRSDERSLHNIERITSHPPRLSRLVVMFPLLDDMQRLIGIRCFCWISGSAHSYANNEATTNLMGQEVLQNISAAFFRVARVAQKIEG